MNTQITPVGGRSDDGIAASHTEGVSIHRRRRFWTATTVIGGATTLVAAAVIVVLTSATQTTPTPTDASAALGPSLDGSAPVASATAGTSASTSPTGWPNASPATRPGPTPTRASGAGGQSVGGLEGFAAISGNGRAATTGGAGGPTVTVTTLAALIAEAAKTGPEIIKVNGLLSGSGVVKVGSDKSIVGVGASSGLTGIGLSIKGQHNVIVQNLNISKVTAASGDGDSIHVDSSDHIWIDHNNLYGDMSHGKDYYDGQIDLTHGADYVTVSWNAIHDHYKLSLVGHSDNNGAEDTGHLHVTYHHNYMYNFGSRTPSLRFGTGHVYDNYFVNGSTGVHSRDNAQMLVQNNVFRNVGTPIETTGDSPDGYVNESGNDFGGGTNAITRTGTFTKPPYSFHLDPTTSVMTQVTAHAGAGKV